MSAMNALGNLLREEIAAAEQGEYGVLVQFAEEKARLSALLEQQLQDDPQAVTREELTSLRELILRDQAYLEQARGATADIVREISELRERHSISGLYGPSGAKRDTPASPGAPVDKSF